VERGGELKEGRETEEDEEEMLLREAEAAGRFGFGSFVIITLFFYTCYNTLDMCYS
jgi:hypothetical protein